MKERQGIIKEVFGNEKQLLEHILGGFYGIRP